MANFSRKNPFKRAPCSWITSWLAIVALTTTLPPSPIARVSCDSYPLTTAQLGHTVKTRQKQDSKICEIDWSYLCLQILNLKRRQLETEVVRICRNFHGKSREIKLGELMLWRIFDIWNHCAPLSSGNKMGQKNI